MQTLTAMLNETLQLLNERTTECNRLAAENATLREQLSLQMSAKEPELATSGTPSRDGRECSGGC